MKNDTDWEVYDKHCKGEFFSIREDLSDIKKSIIGNGRPGLSTRVDRIENAGRLMIWLLSPLYLTGVVILVKMFYDILKDHF